MAENKAAVRDLTVKEGFQLSKFLVKWEMILVYILILINLILAAARPGLYFNIGTIQSIIQSGLDLSPMVMGMVFVLMLGDIDVSIASNMVLSGMTTGLLYQNGAPAVVAVLAGILTGAARGYCNHFHLHAVPRNCRDYPGCEFAEEFPALLQCHRLEKLVDLPHLYGVIYHHYRDFLLYSAPVHFWTEAVYCGK